MVLTQTDLPNLLHKGKVRDTYDLGNGLLLMVSTDRISAFDVILPNGIPHKGIVLSHLSAFWFRKTEPIIMNHFVSLAGEKDQLGEYANHPALSNLPESIKQRSMVVRQAKRIDVECIVRGYLAGSAWSEYQKFGTISGIKAPPGLREADRLTDPLFTPTTKAEIGHDENMTYQQVEALVGSKTANDLKTISIDIYRHAHEYALTKGIIIADTKMEFGLLDGQLILFDELLTPDSSRFWDLELYEPGQSPPNFDKQFVRDWLGTIGWDKEPPAPSLPDQIIQKTSERYMQAYTLLTGKQLHVT